MEKYLNEAFDHLSSVLKTDRMSVQLINEHGYYVFKTWRRISDQYRNAVKDLHLWDTSQSHFEPLFINDTPNDCRFNEIKELVKKEKIKSIIILPLVTNNKLLGRFSIYFSGIHNLNDWERQLISATADAVSVLLDKGNGKKRFTAKDIILLRKRNDELFKTIQIIYTQESFLREVFQIANIGVWEFIVGLEEFKCSEELLCMLGLNSGKQCIPLSELIDTVLPEDINLMNYAIAETINEKKKTELVVRHIKNDKSIIYLNIKIKPQLRRGKVEKLIGTSIDITNYKRTELDMYKSLLSEKEINRQNSQSNLYIFQALQKYLIDMSTAVDRIEMDLNNLQDYERKLFFNNTHNSIDNIYEIVSSLKSANLDLIQNIDLKTKPNNSIINTENDKKGNISKENNLNNRKDNSNRVLVDFGNKSKLIRINDIEYITAIGNYTNLYVINEGKITIRKLLKDWLHILPETNFLRIHRSCAINLEHVQEIEKWYNRSFRIKMKYSKAAFVTSYRYSIIIRKRLKH